MVRSNTTKTKEKRRALEMQCHLSPLFSGMNIENKKNARDRFKKEYFRSDFVASIMEPL
jgi:hypothetical protein